MALEDKVAGLVSSTTALQNTVASELQKVRDENTTFKTTVVEKIASSTHNGFVAFDGTSGKNIKAVPGALIANDFGGAVFDQIFIGLGQAFRSGNNCVVGRGTNLGRNTSGIFNVGFGVQCLTNNTTGTGNNALGVNALAGNTTGVQNTAVGVEAILGNVSGNSNTAIGYFALRSSSANNLTNCTGLGNNTEVTGDNQVQLGNGTTTTYVFGTVQNRSDARDKADIRPTILGLEFVKLLRPVDYRWDMRDSYRTPAPDLLSEDASDAEKLAYEEAMKLYKEGNNLSNITHDGTHKRSRYHHGIIAQELADLIKNTGNDFGGFQDHKRSGGQDVLSVGYDEFIAPLIKAVQELAELNEELRGRIAVLETRK